MTNSAHKKRFALNKLTRDNALNFFKQNNCQASYHILEDDEEFLEALTEKIVEELKEVFDAGNDEELIEELGDLDEVLDTFKRFIGVDQQRIDEVRKQKKLHKGGFEKRVYVKYIDAPKESWEYAYCSKHPEKYPEIPQKTSKKDSA